MYTIIVNDTKTSTLLPVIKRKIAPDSIVYTDHYRSYNALGVSDLYHERINHSKLFARGKNHINGIENFWNQAKRVLRKYNGIDEKFFPLFLKECEFRFNYNVDIIPENLPTKICGCCGISLDDFRYFLKTTRIHIYITTCLYFIC